jgi:hypothetical protein
VEVVHLPVRPPADDLQLAEDLWAASEEINGVRFTLPRPAPR